MDWDIKTIQSFQQLWVSYETVHKSAKLLSSMIKFDEMYRPIGNFRVDPLGYTRGENEYRDIKRARIYLAKKDLIKITNYQGEKVLVLTSQAHKVYFREYPLAKLRTQRWDGNWTLVMYDFPEQMRGQRNSFRKKLVGIGFGMPQESILITPLSIALEISEIIDSYNVKKLSWVLSAKRILGLENKDVAQNTWKLNGINDLYFKLLQALPIVRKSGSKDLDDEWCKLFLAVDYSDPYLPPELLPDDWLGNKCLKEFKKYGLAAILKGMFGSLSRNV